MRPPAVVAACLGLLAAGCVTFALADSVYLFKIAAGTYTDGGLLDVFWPLGLILMGLAAWQPSAGLRAGRLEGWSVMVLPAAVAFGAIALLVYDHYARTAVSAVWLASAALVVCIARAGLYTSDLIVVAGDKHLVVHGTVRIVTGGAAFP